MRMLDAGPVPVAGAPFSTDHADTNVRVLSHGATLTVAPSASPFATKQDTTPAGDVILNCMDAPGLK